MTEQSPEPSHQDPAAPYQDDTQTEVSPQPDPADSLEHSDVTVGGEGVFTTGDPVQS